MPPHPIHPPQPMHYRSLGSTALTVSEIGLGCNRLGEAAMPDSHWIDLVQAAVDRGVNLFDTSESYGWGRSEEMLGRALQGRDEVLVASKVSRVQETNRKDFSAARIIQQAEGSLRRLQRDTIDIYQLHSPSLQDLQSFDWPSAMLSLREQGKIRLIGVSINDAPSGEWLIEQGIVQVLQIPYNLLERTVGDRIIPLAHAHGVGILVRVPMAQGILTGKFSPGQPIAADHRAHLAGDKMARLIAEAEAYRSLAEAADMPLNRFALRFTLSHPGVTATIPGARSLSQLEQNIAASNGEGLSTAALAAIAALAPASV